MLASVDVHIYVEYRIRLILVYLGFAQKHSITGIYRVQYILRTYTACNRRTIRRRRQRSPYFSV
jgi:hypothetical protein